MRVRNGLLLRYWRERSGIDQRAFAASVGISGPYISDIERNRRECPPDVFAAYRRLSRKRG